MLAEKPNYTVTRMARLLHVSRSGFYTWCKARENICPTKLRRSDLDQRVFDLFYANDGEYGSVRIHRLLTEAGQTCSLKSVERSMNRQFLRAACKRKYTKAIVPPVSDYIIENEGIENVIPDLVQRQWNITTINTIWVTDITYIKINNTWLYLCAIEDVASRRIIGWAIDTHQRASLVANAITQACTLRHLALAAKTPDDKVILHADHGSQFTSNQIAQVCREYNLAQSMGQTGVCWDNSMIESFWATLKTEFIKRHTFDTIENAITQIGHWIEHRYNTTRLHSSLGYQSPINYEKNTA